MATESEVELGQYRYFESVSVFFKDGMVFSISIAKYRSIGISEFKFYTKLTNRKHWFRCDRHCDISITSCRMRVPFSP